MSRTRRKNIQNKTIRDGAWYRADRSCENHGSCEWCEGNRKHRHKRRNMSELQDVERGVLRVSKVLGGF